MHAMVNRVLETIRQEQLLKANDTVFVALSGGADSVALLHVLLFLSNDLQFFVRALHVHHGLRGVYADRDEAFVRSLCESLGVPLTVTHVDTRREASQHKESIEEAGRRLRYAFFESECNNIPDAKIATAHSASDQTETVLLHLIRGSGTKGMAGIPIKRGRIIRPFLRCTAEEIRAYCADQSLSYMLDETNDDISYSRNRIRKEIIPSLRKINERIDYVIPRYASIARAEDAFLTALSSQLAEKAMISQNVYSCSVLLEADPVLCHRALIMMCDYAEYRHITDIYSILKSGGSVNLPKDIVAVSDGNTLCFRSINRQKETSTLISVHIQPDSSFSFGDCIFTPTVLSLKDFNSISCDQSTTLYCIAYDENKSYTVRSRQPGDSIQPIGRGCTKSLKKLFNELKIPKDDRENIPILTENNRIAAVLGICVDKSYAITEHTTSVLWIKTQKML